MAEITTSVVGVLVGVTSIDYSFRDESGNERSGTSHRAYVSTAFDAAPVEVTLKADSEWPAKFAAYSAPTPIELVCEVRSRIKGKRAVTELLVIDAADAKTVDALPSRSGTRRAS